MKTWGQSIWFLLHSLCDVKERNLIVLQPKPLGQMLSLWDVKHRCNTLQMVRLCVSSWNGWTSTFFMEIEEWYQLPPSPYAACINTHTAFLLHGKKVHLEVKPIGIGRCFRVLIYSGFLDWSLKHASSSPWEIWHLLRILPFCCLKLKTISILSALILMKRLWNTKFKLKLGMTLEIYSL